jgi:hypothetical protein
MKKNFQFYLHIFGCSLLDPDRGNRFRGLIETAESDMKSYAAPAVNNRKYVNKIETVGSVSAVSLRPRDPNFAHDYLDFLGENEAICKTALGRESGP